MDATCQSPARIPAVSGRKSGTAPRSSSAWRMSRCARSASRVELNTRCRSATKASASGVRIFSTDGVAAPVTLTEWDDSGIRESYLRTGYFRTDDVIMMKNAHGGPKASACGTLTFPTRRCNPSYKAVARSERLEPECLHNRSAQQLLDCLLPVA